MKKLFLLSFVIITATTVQSENLEYQKMLSIRARIIELPPQKKPQPFPILVQEEEILNADIADLLQQLKTLNASHK